MVALSFYGTTREWEKNWEYCYNFFAIISFALLQSNCFNLYVYFKRVCQTPIIEMLSLNPNEKFTCDNSGTQTTKPTLVRHKKTCSVGTLYCTQCPNFSTKSQSDLIYHIAEKHSAPEPDATFKCKHRYQEFPGFYAVREHRNTQPGLQIGSRTRDVDVEHIVGDVEDHRLRGVAFLSTYLGGFRIWKSKAQSFELRSGNSRRNNRKRGTWSFFQQFQMCSKSESGFWFQFEKHRRWRIQRLLRTQNSTLLDRPKLVSTRNDLAKLNDILKTNLTSSSRVVEKIRAQTGGSTS